MSTEEIENYFVESAGYGRDKVRNFMDIVNKALKQKGERIAELEKENAELKVSCKIQVDTAFQTIYEKDEQLTKAKEIIKKLYAVYYDPCVTESDLKYRDELFAEIKQFLKEM